MAQLTINNIYSDHVNALTALGLQLEDARKAYTDYVNVIKGKNTLNQYFITGEDGLETLKCPEEVTFTGDPNNPVQTPTVGPDYGLGSQPSGPSGTGLGKGLCTKELYKLNQLKAEINRVKGLIDSENSKFEGLLLNSGFNQQEIKDATENAIKDSQTQFSNLLDFKTKMPWIIGGVVILIVSIFVYLKFIRKK